MVSVQASPMQTDFPFHQAPNIIRSGKLAFHLARCSREIFSARPSARVPCGTCMKRVQECGEMKVEGQILIVREAISDENYRDVEF